MHGQHIPSITLESSIAGVSWLGQFDHFRGLPPYEFWWGEEGEQSTALESELALARSEAWVLARKASWDEK